MIQLKRLKPNEVKWLFNQGYFNIKGTITKISDTYISGVTVDEKFKFTIPTYMEVFLWIFRFKENKMHDFQIEANVPEDPEDSIAFLVDHLSKNNIKL